MSIYNQEEQDFGGNLKMWHCCVSNIPEAKKFQNFQTCNKKIDHRYCASHFLGYILERFPQYNIPQDTFHVHVRDYTTMTEYRVDIRVIYDEVGGEPRWHKDILAVTHEKFDYGTLGGLQQN